MLLHNETYERQSSLAAFCRGKDFTPFDVLNETRAKQYRRLVQNIFHDTLASSYPLTNDLLATEEWDALIADFVTNHPCGNPQVWHMPFEFYEYVLAGNSTLKTKYPHLTELLHFEWLELEVYMMEDEIQNGTFTDVSDIENSNYTLNAETRIAAFEFPVHLKNANDINQNDKGNYFACLHRHPETGKVLFTNLSVPHVHALQLMVENEHASYVDLIKIFAGFGEKTQAEQALHLFLKTSIASKLLLVVELHETT